MTGLKTNSQVMQLQEMIANKPKPCAMSRALTVEESWRDSDMKYGKCYEEILEMVLKR